MCAVRIIVVLAVGTIFAGCFQPSLTEDRVRSDFSQLYPKLEAVQVAKVEVEQGDAKFIVYYRTPGKPMVRKKLMRYHDPNNEDRWTVSASNDVQWSHE